MNAFRYVILLYLTLLTYGVVGQGWSNNIRYYNLTTQSDVLRKKLSKVILLSIVNLSE